MTNGVRGNPLSFRVGESSFFFSFILPFTLKTIIGNRESIAEK
jgi:hypothetical protein